MRGRLDEGAVTVLELELVTVIVGIVEGTGASSGTVADEGREEEGGGGGDGETTGEGAEEGTGPGGMRVPASQDGGAEGASSMVVPERRVDGMESRCSMNVTWKELNTFPVVTSQRQ